MNSGDKMVGRVILVNVQFGAGTKPKSTNEVQANVGSLFVVETLSPQMCFVFLCCRGGIEMKKPLY